MAPDARGLLIFAHGSGNGRASLCNRMVAELARDGFVAQCPA